MRSSMQVVGGRTGYHDTHDMKARTRSGEGEEETPDLVTLDLSYAYVGREQRQ